MRVITLFMKNILQKFIYALLLSFPLARRGQDFKTLRLGKESVSYIGKIWSSVGHNFWIECDTTAFKIEKKVKYYNPESMAQGMSGSDKAQVIYTLHPKRKGIFVVHEVTNFRGEETGRIKHIIIVKWKRTSLYIGYDTPANYRKRYYKGEIKCNGTFEKRELTTEPKFIQKRRAAALNESTLGNVSFPDSGWFGYESLPDRSCLWFNVITGKGWLSSLSLILVVSPDHIPFRGWLEGVAWKDAPERQTKVNYFQGFPEPASSG